MRWIAAWTRPPKGSSRCAHGSSCPGRPSRARCRGDRQRGHRGDRPGQPVFSSNSFETEEATDAYLSEHANAPYSTLASILLSGRVTPWRARGMSGLLGKTIRDPGYLKTCSRAPSYGRTSPRQWRITTSTRSYTPPSITPADPDRAGRRDEPDPADDYGLGDNRLLSPVTGYPALTVPAGFTEGRTAVGSSCWGVRSPRRCCSGSGMRSSRRRGIGGRRGRLRRWVRAVTVGDGGRCGCGDRRLSSGG